MKSETIIHDVIRDDANYTPSEIAVLMKCSTSTVRRAIKDGRLRARRHGDRLLIVKGADANRWIESFPTTDLENSKGAGASSGMKARRDEDSAFLSVVRGQG